MKAQKRLRAVLHQLHENYTSKLEFEDHGVEINLCLIGFRTLNMNFPPKASV